MKVLEKLGEAAREAASIDQAKRDSGREEHEARVAVLRTALELARPALPVILTRTRFFGDEDQHVAHIGTRDRKESPGVEACRWQLYVTAAGTLIEDSRVWRRYGSWCLLGVGVIDLEKAADFYAPEDVAARLLRHLTAAVEGNNLRRTEEALRRAERYRALAALLESIGGAP